MILRKLMKFIKMIQNQNNNKETFRYDLTKLKLTDFLIYFLWIK